MRTHLRPAIVMLLLFTILTGVVYPAVVTGIAALAFPDRSTGSLIVSPDGKVRGSALIGQPFSDPKFFWSRLSATSPMPYNGTASTGSNLGPSNPALQEAVQTRFAALTAADPTNQNPVPVDLVTASGSGLDPHISPAAARYQIERVARIRGKKVAEVEQLVVRYTERRAFGLVGEPRVNVLLLNLALEGFAPPVSPPEHDSFPVGSRWPSVTH